MVKISVIMPVYNDEESLSDALDSILNQDLEDIEIICVNDGSVDNSLEILNEYASKYDFIKVFTKDNEGSGIARNYALTKATGEYIAYLDSDDVYLDNKALRLMYNLAIRHDAEMVSANLKGINTDGTLENNRNLKRFTNEGFIKSEDYGIPYSFYKNIFKRSFLIENEITFPDLLRGQDPVFLAEILTKITEIPTIPVDLYGFKYSPQSDLLKMNTYRKRYDYIKHFKDTFEILSNAGFNKMKKSYEKKLKDFIKAFHNRYTKEVKDIVFDVFKDDTHILKIVKDMFTNPKISVLICGEKISPDSIEEILSQKLKEIEVICVCDDSLNELCLKDSRIRVLDKTSTILEDRKLAFDNATGDYIYFFNCNDKIEKNALKKAYKKITDNLSDIVIFKADSFNENGLTYKTYFNYDKKSTKLHFSYKKIKKDLFNQGYLLEAKIFEKEFFKSLNTTFEDILIHFTSIFKANFITYIGDVLYHHNLNSNPVGDVFNALDSLEEFLKSENLFSEFESDFNVFKTNEILSAVDEDSFKKAQDTLKAIDSDNLKDDEYLLTAYNILCNSTSFDEFIQEFQRLTFENEVKNYETNINELKNDNSSLKKRNKTIDGENKDILNSTSWKVTKPLRKLKNSK